MKKEVKPIEVGDRIKQLRLSLGKSMTEFGKMIDDYKKDGKVKSGTVSNWETGKNLPNNERLKKIAEICNVSVDYLLYGSNVDEHLEDYKFITDLLQKKILNGPEKSAETIKYTTALLFETIDKILEDDKSNQLLFSYLNILEQLQFLFDDSLFKTQRIELQKSSYEPSLIESQLIPIHKAYEKYQDIITNIELESSKVFIKNSDKFYDLD